MHCIHIGHLQIDEAMTMSKYPKCYNGKGRPWTLIAISMLLYWWPSAISIELRLFKWLICSLFDIQPKVRFFSSNDLDGSQSKLLWNLSCFMQICLPTGGKLQRVINVMVHGLVTWTKLDGMLEETCSCWLRMGVMQFDKKQNKLERLRIHKNLQEVLNLIFE